MYTDYQAEAYFLQIAHELPSCAESSDARAPSSAPGHAKASSIVSGTLPLCRFISMASNLTPNPVIPAK